MFTQFQSTPHALSPDVLAHKLCQTAIEATRAERTDAASCWSEFSRHCEAHNLTKNKYLGPDTLPWLMGHQDRASLIRATRGLKKSSGGVQIRKSTFLEQADTVFLVGKNISVTYKNHAQLFDGFGVVHTPGYGAAGNFTPVGDCETAFHGVVETLSARQPGALFEGSARLRNYNSVTFEYGTLKCSNSTGPCKLEGTFDKSYFSKLTRGTVSYRDGTKVHGDFSSVGALNSIRLKVGEIHWPDGVKSVGTAFYGAADVPASSFASQTASPSETSTCVIVGPSAVTSFSMPHNQPDMTTRVIKYFGQPAEPEPNNEASVSADTGSSLADSSSSHQLIDLIDL